jgi:hypothetical protein
MASSGQSLFFSIRPEYYAQLTLDALIASLVQSTGGGSLLQPPLPQAILDIAQGGGNQTSITTVSQLVKALGTSKFSKTWAQWVMAVYRYIIQGAPASQLLEVIAPSVDETDDDWWGESTVNGTSDPVTASVALSGISRFGPLLTMTAAGSGYSGTVSVTVASSNGQGQAAKGTAMLSAGGVVGWVQSTQGYNLAEPLVVTFGGPGTGAKATALLGRQFSVGDFVIWNDPTIVSSAYSYEIDQIASITPTDDTHFSCSLTRAAAGVPSGQAQYGSLKNPHSNAALFRLINKSWLFNLDAAAGPQSLNFLWANMCVAAVTISQQGQSAGSVTVNLAPLPYLEGTTTDNPRLTPPSPGLRTMNGAAYVSLGFAGTLTVGATSAVRVPVQAWESIRTSYAMVRQAPTGPTTFNGDANACVVVYVCYISPGGLVGLIDTLVIDTSDFTSYSSTNAPDGRQMPFHTLWGDVAPNFDWPPNLLPELTGALSGSGNLQLGFTISTTTQVVFAPDGVIDFIVAQIGTTVAGSGLTVAVQT